MNKVICKEDKNNNIEDEKIYEILHHTIENWPDWKKEEYNTNFAVPEYTKKLSIINVK
jgi:hypothetical protein